MPSHFDPFAFRLERRLQLLHRRGAGDTSAFIVELLKRIGGAPAAVGLLNEFEARPLPRRRRSRQVLR